MPEQAPGRFDPDRLVQRIDASQSRGSSLYPVGLFPSRRTHALLPYAVDDDSVFFAAAIVYTLGTIEEGLSTESKKRVSEMKARLAGSVHRYRNREGLPIYNYWQTHPGDRAFPNGRVLSRFRKFRLPEDIDTTAYVYLAGFHGRADALWLQRRLAVHANGAQRWIRHSFPHHRHRRAYSTWMGQDNMPVDFDLCAMANMLLALRSYRLDLSKTDREAVRLICDAVHREEHLTHPFRSAPWYASTPVILYHLARLAARSEIDELRQLTGRLRTDVVRMRALTDLSAMEQLLLSTSSMWLGERSHLASPAVTESEIVRYPFFMASLLAVPENAVARALAPRPLFHLRYVCPAHTLALLAEHELLRRRLAAQPPSGHPKK